MVLQNIPLNVLTVFEFSHFESDVLYASTWPFDGLLIFVSVRADKVVTPVVGDCHVAVVPLVAVNTWPVVGAVADTTTVFNAVAGRRAC